VTQIDPSTNTPVADFDPPGAPGDILLAFGSLWIVTSDPNQLVGVDPATDQIVGDQPLPAPPGTSRPTATGCGFGCRVLCSTSPPH
jgi:hypothetical protein